MKTFYFILLLLFLDLRLTSSILHNRSFSDFNSRFAVNSDDDFDEEEGSEEEQENEEIEENT